MPPHLSGPVSWAAEGHCWASSCAHLNGSLGEGDLSPEPLHKKHCHRPHGSRNDLGKARSKLPSGKCCQAGIEQEGLVLAQLDT